VKFKIRPIRFMKKGRTKVPVACDASKAQAYQILDKKGRVVRTERQRAEAERIVALFDKPKRPKDRDSLIGKRWSSVQDKL
jgi:hypothetical protein